uniref:Fimbrial protein YehD n=2 Tax=Salmonella enterica TaxID=28901 RepID=A0A8E9RVJ6_SALET|nr:fimbrial protein YehD [Salmonella enterica subsp. enterica]
MKRSLIAASVLSAVFMSAGVFAADEYDIGVLNINGKVVGTSCTFEGANSATIELSQVGVDRLTDLNPGDIYTGYTSPEAILKVKCTNTANPRISFNRSQFVDNMQITKNNATNNGAGFAVYLDGTQVKPDEAGNYTLNSSKFENGVYTLNFSARYAAVENTVTPGSVESVLTMTVLTD